MIRHMQYDMLQMYKQKKNDSGSRLVIVKHYRTTT